jgi:multicomponent K+:H+ antiporter subunit D
MNAFLVKHLTVLPIAVPLIGAAIALLVGERRIPLQRLISFIVTLLLLSFGALAIAVTARDQTLIYLLGNWQAPFGIALAVDRLTAIMLMLTAGIAIVVLLGSGEATGGFFYPLFMLQLMGLNGAFLTADLFNLFVFFEVLLAASYGLLLQHADRLRTNMAVHYVTINLVGSALFLIAVSLLYGVTGTLNMSDLSLKISALSASAPHNTGLVYAAAFLLIVVFAIKAALLPLGFWLTGTYGSAIVPVAALFALMTKVGVYSIMRASTLIFPADGSTHVHIAAALMWIAPLTLLMAACGALAARDVRTLIGWTIVGSAGFLVTAIAIGNARALSGAMVYLIGSSIAAALLFLVSAAIRSGVSPAINGNTTSNAWQWVAGLFFLAAVTAVGLPPFSGFIGKALVLSAAAGSSYAGWIFASILLASFITLLGYVRLGVRLFWKHDATVELSGYRVPAMLLASALVALTVFAAPLQRFTDRAATQLLQPSTMSAAVLGARPLAKEGTK